jgi:hypothetical protein
MSTEEKINIQFKSLEQDIVKWDAMMKDVPAIAHAIKPVPHVWSALEIMQHLIMVEKMSLAYLKKKNQAASLPPAGLMNGVKRLLIKYYARIPFKVKAPSMVDVPLPPGSTYDSLMMEWKDIRSQTQVFIASLSSERRSSLIYRHVIFGMVSIDLMLLFIHEHFNRHFGQLKFTLDRVKELGPPKS